MPGATCNRPPRTSPQLTGVANSRPRRVIDLAFLDTSGPTAVLAVLSEDLQHARHLRTYAVDLAKKAFNPGPIAHVPNLEGGAHALVPVPRPLGGALVLGEATAHYLASTETQVAQPLPPSARRAWSPVLGGASDSFRALVGSDLGFLHLVAVHTDEGGAPRVRVEELGAIHPPHSLAFLGHGLAFVGSQAADSQLIRIHEEPIGGCMRMSPIVARCCVSCATPLTEGLQSPA